MSDVVVILEKLKEEGFSLWLEKLRYKAPKESITKANLLTLKRNKEEIIQVLQNYSKRIVVEVDSDNRYEPFPLTDEPFLLTVQIHRNRILLMILLLFHYFYIHELKFRLSEILYE